MTAFNLLIAGAENSAGRMVLAGSFEEPDEVDTAPCSPYAAAKWAASGYARMFHALYQVPVVVAKIFMVYGPGQLDYTKLIPYVTLSLLRGEAPMLSSGARLVDWIYVDDVVDGLIGCAQAPGIEGRTVNSDQARCIRYERSLGSWLISSLPRLAHSSEPCLTGSLSGLGKRISSIPTNS